MTETFSMRAGFASLGCLVRPLNNVLTQKKWYGYENLPKHGFILVANHISELDPLTMGHMVYNAGYLPHFLAKKQLFEMPVLGKLLVGLNQVPVDRAAGGKESLDAAEEIVADGNVVIIYPEGTITKDPEGWPMVAKTGAARLALKTGAPVIPAGQWGVQEVLPRGAKGPSILPRKVSSISIGAEVELDDLRESPLTGSVLKEATRRMMTDITAQVAFLRDEEPPENLWDPHQHTERN